MYLYFTQVYLFGEPSYFEVKIRTYITFREISLSFLSNESHSNENANILNWKTFY